MKTELSALDGAEVSPLRLYQRALPDDGPNQKRMTDRMLCNHEENDGRCVVGISNNLSAPKADDVLENSSNDQRILDRLNKVGEDLGACARDIDFLALAVKLLIPQTADWSPLPRSALRELRKELEVVSERARARTARRAASIGEQRLKPSVPNKSLNCQ